MTPEQLAPEPSTPSPESPAASLPDGDHGDGGDHLVIRIFDHTVQALAALVLAGITLLLFVNASARHFLDSPIGWADEVATGLVLWLSMLGLLIAARRRDLITVRVFVRSFPYRAQVWLKVFADIVTAIVFTHLAWVSFQYVQAFGLDETAYLRLPKGFFMVALPVGAAAVAVVTVLQIPAARAVVGRYIDDDRAARASEPAGEHASQKRGAE